MTIAYLVPELAPLAMAWSVLRARLAASRADEDGYSTETVIVTALLAALAIFTVGLIVAAVSGTASKIRTE